MSNDIYTVLVCGGRDFGLVEEEYYWIISHLDRLASERWPRLPPDEYGNWLPDVRIVTGGAKGVDQVAIDWAVVNWVYFTEYPAKWDLLGQAAGPIRNQEMLDQEKPNVVVAFPGGKGTANMVKLAKKAGVPIIQIEDYPDED